MSVRRDLLRSEITTIVLLGMTTALLVGGFFFSVLLLPAVAIALVLVTRKMQWPPMALLAAAWLFVILAGVGFIVLALSWDKLGYSITGYLVVCGPFIAAFCAVVFFITYFHTCSLNKIRQLNLPVCPCCHSSQTQVQWLAPSNFVRIPTGVLIALILGHSVFRFLFRCTACGKSFLASPNA